MMQVIPKTIMQRLIDAEARIAALERQIGANDILQMQQAMQAAAAQNNGYIGQQAQPGNIGYQTVSQPQSDNR